MLSHLFPPDLTREGLLSSPYHNEDMEAQTG